MGVVLAILALLFVIVVAFVLITYSRQLPTLVHGGREYPVLFIATSNLLSNKALRALLYELYPSAHIVNTQTLRSTPRPGHVDEDVKLYADRANKEMLDIIRKHGSKGPVIFMGPMVYGDTTTYLEQVANVVRNAKYKIVSIPHAEVLGVSLMRFNDGDDTSNIRDFMKKAKERIPLFKQAYSELGFDLVDEYSVIKKVVDILRDDGIQPKGKIPTIDKIKTWVSVMALTAHPNTD